MPRAFRQQAFDELEAEGDGGLDQFGVVVGGEGGAASGQGVSRRRRTGSLDGFVGWSWCMPLSCLMKWLMIPAGAFCYHAGRYRRFLSLPVMPVLSR